MTWACTRARASSCGQCIYLRQSQFPGKRLNNANHHLRAHQSPYHSTSYPLSLKSGLLALPHCQTRYYSGPPKARDQSQILDREVIVSVLESSATRRDAKGYLQKFAAKDSATNTHAVGTVPTATALENRLEGNSLHVAITKVRDPQNWSDIILKGVAKTITQLRSLGLLSVVVLDCGPNVGYRVYQDQAFRLCEALDSFGEARAKVTPDLFLPTSHNGLSEDNGSSSGYVVDDRGLLRRLLQRETIPIVPSLEGRDDGRIPRAADSLKTTFALTKYFIGMQSDSTYTASDDKHSPANGSRKIASVERIILLDPLGGIPETGRYGASHRFINLEQEYGPLMREIGALEEDGTANGPKGGKTAATIHGGNLTLAKLALSVLPPSASALITSPVAAANTKKSAELANHESQVTESSSMNFKDMAKTRTKQNPLLHNLLTDKPVFSSSLPVQRLHISPGDIDATESTTATTLVKRGMPLTIYPSPWRSPWQAPKPGSPHLRLTDTFIDLPRLTYLIEDSFNRKIDMEDYLRRVNDSLAGIIIAGEYEGGAILTWECPEGLDMATAYKTNRLVPYLDKFAVLKSRQGSGGVADMVFNAMVRNCFPRGVCWRSRKNNPVNKWYFERSIGTKKLSDSNWTMFWTTPMLDGNHPTLADYESVCRSVQPSWADNKHIVD